MSKDSKRQELHMAADLRAEIAHKCQLPYPRRRAPAWANQRK